MELTNDIIENEGFERVNNSMWRLDSITLQNGFLHYGDTVYMNSCPLKTQRLNNETK